MRIDDPHEQTLAPECAGRHERAASETRMNVGRRLLMAWAARLPAREIRGDDGAPYLERYFVVRALGWTVYLHRFVASDPDRGLHDHPWSRAVSLVLAGGYDEERQAFARDAGDVFRPVVATVRRRPGRLNFLRGWDFHRVVLAAGAGDCWSLFAHGPVVKEWGFLVAGRDGRAIHIRYPSTFGWWRRAGTGRALRGRRG